MTVACGGGGGGGGGGGRWGIGTGWFELTAAYEACRSIKRAWYRTVVASTVSFSDC